MTFPSVRAAPIVRPYYRVAADEIESRAGEFRRHWRDSLLASARNEAARRRDAEVQRQVAAARRQEDFAAARAAFHLAQDRERVYRGRGRS
ncbi:MAG: hypothetical protein ACTHPS_30845 [Streptosporangiaceae bacterium]